MTRIEREEEELLDVKNEAPDWSTIEEDVDDEPGSTHALFDGDEGGLELEQRKALVVLLKNRFITSTSHPKEWRTIADAPSAIRRNLNDLFLELVFDPDREVAYKRQAIAETGNRPFLTLLHDTAWQREETVLLVYLRIRFRNEQAAGNTRIRVSTAEMLEHIEELRPTSATDRISDGRRAERAVDAMVKAGLLTKTDEDSTFEVSPAIEVMMPVQKLQDLLDWLKQRTSVDDTARTGSARETEA